MERTAKRMIACGGMLALALMTGCQQDSEEVQVALAGDTGFPAFKDATPYIEESDTYVVEGDIAVPGVAELREYYARNFTNAGALAINLDTSGNWSRFSEQEKKALVYCIDSDGMSSGELTALENGLEEAMDDWSKTADLNFIYIGASSGCDASSNIFGTPVSFFVKIDATMTAGFCGLARFPHDADRGLYIRDASVINNPSACGAITDLAAFLKHELGHTLGFRHEHIRVPDPTTDGSCTENGNWEGLTPYDNQSIMAYYNGCQTNPGGSWDNLSSDDRTGAFWVYSNGPAVVSVITSL